MNSECESGYEDTVSDCDIREEEGEEEGVVGEPEMFTDEGRESVETGEADELDEDSLASTELLTDTLQSPRDTLHVRKMSGMFGVISFGHMSRPQPAN